MKIFLGRRRTLMVDDGAFSHKIDYITFFRRIKISKGIQIALLFQKLWLWNAQPAKQACLYQILTTSDYISLVYLFILNITYFMTSLLFCHFT